MAKKIDNLSNEQKDAVATAAELVQTLQGNTYKMCKALSCIADEEVFIDAQNVFIDEYEQALKTLEQLELLYNCNEIHVAKGVIAAMLSKFGDYQNFTELFDKFTFRKIRNERR